MAGVTPPGWRLKVQMQNVKEEQARARTLSSSDIPTIDSKPGLRHTLPILLGVSVFFFPSIKLQGQPIKQLLRRVLKIPPSEAWVATLRFGRVQVD